ncbi:hypothetical protein EKO27_g9319 [Xylaria grammica]|uniref:Uncharacterized protein n=1 Tax=Xylaria grammica TaxID=363999 RepID=A0A439CUG4_9PEZI|nr:hypothetical protein EKO27_g9319 [Xylaria grammica]
MLAHVTHTLYNAEINCVCGETKRVAIRRKSVLETVADSVVCLASGAGDADMEDGMTRNRFPEDASNVIEVCNITLEDFYLYPYTLWIMPVYLTANSYDYSGAFVSQRVIVFWNDTQCIHNILVRKYLRVLEV